VKLDICEFQILLGATHRIAIRRIKVVIINTANAILVSLCCVVQAVQNQSLRLFGEEVVVFFYGDDQSCANEATPIRIPRVVDVRSVHWRADIWLFRVFLVIAEPKTW
jgi:hypothetical protein